MQSAVLVCSSEIWERLLDKGQAVRVREPAAGRSWLAPAGRQRLQGL